MLKDLIKSAIDEYIDSDFKDVVTRINEVTGVHVSYEDMRNIVNNNQRKDKFIDNMLREMRIMESRHKIYDIRHLKTIKDMSKDFAKLFCMLSLQEKDVGVD